MSLKIHVPKLKSIFHATIQVFFLFLELWNYNETQIEDLTDEEVLEVVTEALDDDRYVF